MLCQFNCGVLVFLANGVIMQARAATVQTRRTSNLIARSFVYQLNNQQFEGTDSPETAGYFGPNAPL